MIFYPDIKTNVLSKQTNFQDDIQDNIQGDIHMERSNNAVGMMWIVFIIILCLPEMPLAGNLFIDPASLLVDAGGERCFLWLMQTGMSSGWQQRAILKEKVLL